MSATGATLDILARLIAFDTTSRHSNLALIEWVEDFLRARGVASRRVANADGTKANLYALIGQKQRAASCSRGTRTLSP